MTVRDELGRVMAQLKRTIRGAGLTQRAISRELGQHPHYLGQLFAGKARLKEEVVYRVLRLCGVSLRDFYAELTSPAFSTLAERPTVEGPISAEEARKFIRDALGERRPRKRAVPAAELGRGTARQASSREASRHSQRVMQLLRAKVQRSGLRQRDISRNLGEHPDYLSQVLRGNVALKTEHVLGVLQALETTPAVFYSELYSNPPALPSKPAAEVVRGVTWGEILALIDQELEAAELRRGAVLTRPERPGRSERPLLAQADRV